MRSFSLRPHAAGTLRGAGALRAPVVQCGLYFVAPWWVRSPSRDGDGSGSGGELPESLERRGREGVEPPRPVNFVSESGYQGTHVRVASPDGVSNLDAGRVDLHNGLARLENRSPCALREDYERDPTAAQLPQGFHRLDTGIEPCRVLVAQLQNVDKGQEVLKPSKCLFA